MSFSKTIFPIYSTKLRLFEYFSRPSSPSKGSLFPIKSSSRSIEEEKEELIRFSHCFPHAKGAGINIFTREKRADEGILDPKKLLEDRCQGRCVKTLYSYRECVQRVKEDESGHKHCTGQYFDYWSCVDQCAAEKLFGHLK